MTSAHIRGLLDRYGRYNQEPALFLQVVQVLEEYLLHLVGHEQELGAQQAYDKMEGRHPLIVETTYGSLRAFFVGKCECGWTMEKDSLIGGEYDAERGSIYSKHADHVHELVNAAFKEK